MAATLLLILVAALAAAHGDPEAPALIARALAGERAALRALTRRLVPVIQARVNAFYTRRGGQALGAHDAADLVQDVWVALVADDGRALRAYDPTRGMSVEGYVGLLTRRELWRATEREGREKRGAGVATGELDERQAAPGADPEARVVERDLLDTMWAHVDAALALKGRLVLRYLYVDGLDPQETAQAMGVNLQVVYNWQHKIRGLAREWFAAQAG